jgi:hypothetical protein
MLTFYDLMSKLLLLIFAISLLNLQAQIFVAPDGDDNNLGTFESPFRSLTKAISVSGADSLIYMRGGVYNDSTTIRLNKTGALDRPIKIWAYPGEKPIIDFYNQPVSTSSRGIQISHNYWHLKGLEIRNAKDNGIYISSWYNTVENCVIHNCHDTGLQISGNGSYNLILNCDSYENFDPLTNGENADGFAPKLDIGPGNIFRGCRAWGNSDDGWDMYEADQPVVIENSWAFRNGFNIWGIPNFQGDGNGFKLGGNYIPASHTIINCIAFDNKSKGFDQNNNTAGITLYNNTGWRNQSRNFSFPTAPVSGFHMLKNNISYSGSNSIVANSIIETNSWNGFTVADSDFLSLDTLLALTERDSNFNLPDTDFLRLAVGSLLIDAGVPVGLPYNDAAPDLGAFETDGVPSSVQESNSAIRDFNIQQNFPNPFNPSTKFIYEVYTPGKIILEIFNAIGQKVSVVVNDLQSTGIYEVTWLAKDEAGNILPSGIYLAKLSSGNTFRLVKMLLVK